MPKGRLKTKNFGLCSVEGCDKKAYCREMCKACYERWLRHTNPEWMKAHNEKSAKARRKPGWKKFHSERMKNYRRTKQGWLQECYVRMRKRVEGKTKHTSAHVWKGLPICSKEDFYAWALTRKDFDHCWRNFSRNPNTRNRISIDRIDHKKGYLLPNMRFLPLHANKHHRRSN